MHQSLERATGTLKATISGSENRIGELYQEGSSRLFFPKSFSKIKECVVINTAGGITGGDKFQCSIEASEESSIIVTTQASEKVYKANNGSAEVEMSFFVSKNSKLLWLPQDTILFSNSALSREITIRIEDSSEFLAFDQIVLGRSAMGESIQKSNPAVSPSLLTKKSNRITVVSLDFESALLGFQHVKRSTVASDGLGWSGLVTHGPQLF